MLVSVMCARLEAINGGKPTELVAKLRDGALGYRCPECDHATHDPLVAMFDDDRDQPLVFHCPKCNDNVPRDRPIQIDDVMPHGAVAGHSRGRGFVIGRPGRSAIYLGPWPGVDEPKQVIAIIDRDGVTYTRIGELYNDDDRAALELVLRFMAVAT